eukprot:scaffold104189_cov53-Attheya_sp.AAC.1
MGNDMSSHASSVSDASTVTGSSKEQQPFGVRGRNNTTNRETSGDKSASKSSKSTLMIQPTNESCDFTEVDMIDSSDDLSYYENDQSDMLSEDEYDSDDEEEDDEDEEFVLERMRILEETKKLGQLARAVLHPEDPVQVAPWATGRCYFDRPSAPPRESVEEAEERMLILADAMALQQAAHDYLHPEMGVTSNDPTSFGRNYFNRASAPEQESVEEAEERVQILADAAALKKLAIDYAHPELGVTTNDPTSFGRNYYCRASAPEQEDSEEAEERAQILADALAFKKLAVDYAHPELGVTSSDPTSFGRNYFRRPSAPEEESVEEAEERAQIIADAAALKKLAIDFAHPEIGVTTSDPTSFGRNYFRRPSAPEQEDSEERAQILADALAFKKLAVDYAHPEIGVTGSDPTSFGRNYYSRPSAPEQESMEEAEERAEILVDVLAFKKLAVNYAHPEIGVTTSDPTSFGRNYFNRASAPEQESVEEAEERAQILDDALALKKLAIDYAHPEIGVTTSDPTSFGRNYFNRASAPEQEDSEEAEERAQIIADALVFKKLAVDYAHPEIGVTTSDPTSFGRNYFNRASAPEQESVEEAEELAQILDDALALKKLAIDYAHPEIGVTTSDPTSFGRNYCSRPSAPEQEDSEEAEQRAQILADALVFKKLAVDYAHPKIGVTSSDPTSFGRNYFNRPSAPEQESMEDAEERAQILDDALALKKLAIHYAHPEIGVTTSDPTAFGRNYFSRPSAPEMEDFEYAEERHRILAEMVALKTLAIAYFHPEV